MLNSEEELKECINSYVLSLNSEVLEILSNNRFDKIAKDKLIKKIATKKQILLNTIDALEMVNNKQNG